MNRLILISFLILFSTGIAIGKASDILVLGLFKDMIIFKLDETRYKLRTGESTPNGIKLIHSSSEQAVLEINGIRQTYTLGTHQGLSAQPDQRQSSEAKIWAHRGMYQTTGMINGQPVKLLVDTGASKVAMGTEHAKQLGINYRVKGRRSTARTASGVVNTWVLTLDSVRVGDIELKNVGAAVIEGAGPGTILLGMSFLKHVKMQREGNLLQLQQMH